MKASSQNVCQPELVEGGFVEGELAEGNQNQPS